MRARIFQPARTAMSSGMAQTHHWVLEYAPAERLEIDPLMGWTGSGDMNQQIRLTFATRQEALDYASDKGLEVTVIEPQERRFNIRPGGYGENFATNRRAVWTH